MTNNKDDSFSVPCPSCSTTIEWPHPPVLRSTVFYKCPHCGSLLNGDSINRALTNRLLTTSFLPSKKDVVGCIWVVVVIGSIAIPLIGYLFELIAGLFK